MTDLVRHLTDLIRADGPISIAEFMRIALTGRSDSYYRRGDPFGAAGDFVTAPEISQVFGELIGLWCVDLWQKLGSPKRFTLVELGPGRGTLMKDALRAARVAPTFLEAASVALVDVSEALQKKQREAIGAAAARWHQRFEDVEVEGPVIVIANEFFDALPIRQYVRTIEGWVERCVGLGADDSLMFGATPGVVDARLIPESLRNAAVGSVVELSPARATVARALGESVARIGGAALVIDYGFFGPAAGDTLQAVTVNAFAEVLAQPGTADLTSHVDFTALGSALVESGTRVGDLATQGDFLNRLGAFERTQMLKREATTAQAEALDAAYRRLTAPDAMGSLFKVLCAVWPASIQPAGFSGV
jgi:NADH dehydrogenase [ubiquinone] 1 alpha subcomplex assembly factor 7